MDLEVGYHLYLPPGYDEASQAETRYPVVYHLHGGRPGGEFKSVGLARFVDEAIKAEKIEPTIYVFPNGGPMSWYNYPQIDNGQGEDVFVKELIPHIRETYRTRELALEGFSQGGRGTTRIMFRHPELFVSAAPGKSSARLCVLADDVMQTVSAVLSAQARHDRLDTTSLGCRHARRIQAEKELDVVERNFSG